jgi:phage protein D
MADGTSTDNALRAARPTLRVDGREQAELAAGLLELSIVETDQGLYRCEATFGNWGPKNGETGFLYFDRALLDFGKPFEVRLGTTDVLFEGRIMALEADFPESAPPTLTVLAEDRLQDLRMTRRTTTYADVSDADVLRQVASKHGLTPELDVSGPTHKVLAQVNQSDLAFLRERCRAVDVELWVEGRTLKAKKRGARATGEALKLGRGNELTAFTVLADLATQRSAVTVSGWSVQDKEALTHEAGPSVLGAELGSDESGASLLSSKLAERKEAVVHAVPLGAQEAQARAEGLFRQMARRFVVGRGTAQTDARLRVGTRVELTGLGPLFSGKYHLAEVKHLFDGERGLRTEFLAERVGLGRAS